MKKIRIGVSSCLLGNPVRYDGQHQRNAFVCDELRPYVEYVPVCPEVECGLPVPREAMHLEGNPKDPRLVTINSKRDLTNQMQTYVAAKLDELAKAGLDGFIFKKDSPSSGLERVKVYNNAGVPARTGRGMFAGAFADRFPELPMIEEGMLNDQFLRERFLNRIFTNQHWQELSAADRSKHLLSDFQARHKLMLMSHAPGKYHELGQIVETGDFAAYFAKLNEIMTHMPSVSKHVNVMQHILGYFKKDLAAWEKSELLEALGQYREGLLRIEVPLTLLRHYSRKFGKDYLLDQTYWDILGRLYL